ncbi:hypothetical protein SAMN05444678_108132 [Sphingomonas sp. YR710]|nr:hypothetical protein SAMN05444678_108132 [Sphingomonas sp. YR710]
MPDDLPAIAVPPVPAAAPSAAPLQSGDPCRHMPEKGSHAAVRVAVDTLAASPAKAIRMRSNRRHLVVALGGGAMATVGAQRWLSRLLGDDLAALFLVMIVLVVLFGLLAPRVGNATRK